MGWLEPAILFAFVIFVTLCNERIFHNLLLLLLETLLTLDVLYFHHLLLTAWVHLSGYIELIIHYFFINNFIYKFRHDLWN